VNDDPVRRRALEAQVEQWTAEAKKQIEAGRDDRALELYRLAADDLPGAPWLQHRTAELARKLKQPDVAITYFRRAATAFQIAAFSKRAIAPLRTGWTLAIDGLPGSSKTLVELAGELIQLQRRLGYESDAGVTLERTNAALRARGFSEITPQVTTATAREATPPLSEAAPKQAPSSSPSEPATRTRTPPPRFSRG
jgi:hypothetical protein